MEENEKKQTVVLVAEYGNIQVLKEAYGFSVVEIRKSKNTGKEYRSGRTQTFHSTLPDYLLEVSKRLFSRKLVKRANEAKKDFESLRQLVEEHNEEIRQTFGLRV